MLFTCSLHVPLYALACSVHTHTHTQTHTQTHTHRLRIRKEGDAGPKGGPPGDLYVFLTVKTDPNFKRDGADIYSQVSLFSLFQIFEGKKISFFFVSCHLLAGAR